MNGREPFSHDLTTLVSAPVVCLSGRDGQIREQGCQGVLAADVRVLSRAVVTVDGGEPEPLADGTTSASTGYFIGALRGLGDRDGESTVWLRRDREVRSSGLTETFTVVNGSAQDLDVSLRLDVATDRVPMSTIRTGRAAPAAVVVVDHDLPADGQWHVHVPAGTRRSRSWSMIIEDDPGAVVGPPPHRLERSLTVVADDSRLPRLIDRALDDLDALLLVERGQTDLFVGAGAPWYLTLFGRDAIWAATMLLPVDLRVARGTLRTFARLQGARVDRSTAEEPGKIVHELRRPDSTDASALPPLYYGTIDATPLWICLLRDAWRWGLPPGDVEALLPHLEAALGWIAEHADRDGDGFAEYVDESGRGLANQGWKDSVDSIRFADGTIAQAPVALVEVQGYLYEAALAGAELLDAFGRAGGQRWREHAADLAARFRASFWVDGLPALALDGNKTPVDAVASNMGHLLGSGLLDHAESERVGARLLEPDMAGGYGLRTMSSTAGGYAPLSYHCGSVWPHDTAIVMRCLARAGQSGRAAALATSLLVTADAFGFRLPELFAGFGDDEVVSPVPYPTSCRPQAWAAAAAVVVLQTVLGLTVDAPAGVIRLRPLRPSPVGAISIRGLRVGDGSLDVDIDRDGRITHVDAPTDLHVDVG